MFKKIVIIGIGLMGGSLGAACRKAFPESRVVGISRSRKARATALKKKWVHEATRDVARGALGADLVVLCTPVDIFLPYLRIVDKVCRKGALVLDIGSVKASVLRQVNGRRWQRISFVGCHPMVGSHRRGTEAVSPDLYQGGQVLLTRDRKTRPRAWNLARKFWASLSMKAEEMTPETHDRLVGEASHLPHAIAACLMHTVSASALKVTSAGFRDTTRIAGSSPSIWRPIFISNRKVVLRALTRFDRHLKNFRKLLKSRSFQKLSRFLEIARRKREMI